MRTHANLGSAEKIQTLDQAIDDRIKGLIEWIAENAPECRDQAHLNSGSPERAYWHAGYLTALRDIRELLGRQNFNSLN